MKIISRKQAKGRGLKHYFTGVKCIRGHIDKRLVTSTTCSSCVRENHYTWYNSHKKQALAIIGKWQKKNKKKVNKATQKWRNIKPDNARASVQLYYVNNKETKLAGTKRWRLDNPDLIRMYNVKRRKQIEKATPTWANFIEIRKIYKRATRKQTRTGNPYHVDHIIPLHHKLVCGLHIPENLQIISGPDNIKKGNKFGIE